MQIMDLFLDMDIEFILFHNKSNHDSSSSYEGMNQLILVKEKNLTVSDYEVFQIKFQ